ncbi:MAG: MBL fold metallo-hydrolase RNA specificity domain-containing protein, partial [Bacteroidota bacterium]
HEDPFGFGRLQYIRTVEESKKLNDLKSSCIIISASGMCEGGRVVHHLANTIEDPKNTILFVGYQAEHTLGRRLVEKQQEVTIFGDVYKVNAEIAILNSFSAHAGQDEIVGYIEQVDKAKLKEIFLVHGEIEQAEKLKAKLAEHHYENIVIPQRGDKVELL